MTRSERVAAAVCKREVFTLAAVLVICLTLSISGPNFGARSESLPRLVSTLRLKGSVEPFLENSTSGNALSDGNGVITTGLWKRKQVETAFGPPPQIAWQMGREMWCYQLPPDGKGDRLYLTVCFESFLGMDELTHFTLGKKLWVFYPEPNPSFTPSHRSETFDGSD